MSLTVTEKGYCQDVNGDLDRVSGVGWSGVESLNLAPADFEPWSMHGVCCCFPGAFALRNNISIVLCAMRV